MPFIKPRTRGKQLVKHRTRLDRENNEILDARLEDGSRVAAMFPPCAVDGPTLTVRKFIYRRYSLDDLVTVGSACPSRRSHWMTAANRIN